MAGPAGRKRAPSVRPNYNVFPLLDLMTGRHLRGQHGAWYLNGGHYHIMGYAGRGNTFKTAFSMYNFITAYARYEVEYGEIYDTEMSFNIERLIDFCKQIPEAKDLDFSERILADQPTFNIVDSTLMYGDEWWKGIRDSVDDRKKLKPNQLRQTVFKDFDGSYVSVPNPWFFEVDSMTELKVKVVENMHDKAIVGASELNTEAMKGGAAKSQLMGQMPLVTGGGGFYMGLVAHAGDEIKMDMYSPSHKKLSGLKGDLKLKGVPEKFSFLTNNCFIATSTKPLLDSKKLPEFPVPGKPEVVGDTDLTLVRFEQLRGKGGPTGAVLDLVFSQKEGFQEGLTNFYYIKDICKGFGMEVKGNNQGFRLDLYPEVYFTRKNVRQLIKDDPKFRRALEITASNAFMFMNWFDLDPELRCTMTELREDLIKMGYDWDEILTDTVYYWYFQDQAKKIGKPTISPETLLQMRAGNYVAKQLKTHPKG